MEKKPTNSTNLASKTDGSLGSLDGYMLPKIPQISALSGPILEADDAYLLPNSQKLAPRAFLDGNFARRKHPAQAQEYTIWDTELVGFGLRVRPSGSGFWVVRMRHRGKQRRVTLGRTEDVDAVQARLHARRLLAEVALDGLPKRSAVKAAPLLSDYVDFYWGDIARYWKPSTAKRSAAAWRRDLAPVFGGIAISDVTKADVTRWRDDCAGPSEAIFNRAVPVLASLFKYAEALQLRPKGSNPCRGMPRYKRAAKDRYLSPLEYRRLGEALRAAEARSPAQVAVVWLLLYTGARISEIRDLQWEWVRPPHLALPDSKSGPKTIWLNSQALRVLADIPRRDGSPYVFPDKSGTAPISMTFWWATFRRTCSMPDLRIHDLRHSFASTAIMDNVPLATIGKLLGHMLPETTARYAHLSDDVIADAAQRISGALAKAIGLPT